MLGPLLLEQFNGPLPQIPLSRSPERQQMFTFLFHLLDSSSQGKWMVPSPHHSDMTRNGIIRRSKSQQKECALNPGTSQLPKADGTRHSLFISFSKPFEPSLLNKDSSKAIVIEQDDLNLTAGYDDVSLFNC